MTYEDFKKEVQNLSGHRVHKVTNSLGVYDAYKWLRKRKWEDIGRCLTEHEFYSIIRRVNNYLRDSLLCGKEVTFPCKMGKLELRKVKTFVDLKNGKVITNYPIDWNKTLRLWYEDEEAYKNKTLIKMEEKEIFKIFYNKGLADYNNQIFFEFQVNRDIKRGLVKRIKDGSIDAFNLSRNG